MPPGVVHSLPSTWRTRRTRRRSSKTSTLTVGISTTAVPTFSRKARMYSDIGMIESSGLGRGARRRNQRINGRCDRLAVDDQSIARDAFEPRTGLLGDTATRDVVNRGDDLDSRQAQRFEAELRKTVNGGDGKSRALTGLTYPIAQVGEIVIAIEMIETGAAEVFAGAVEQGEVVLIAALPARSTPLDPGDAVALRVFGVTPGHPAADALERFDGGRNQERRVLVAVGSQCNRRGLEFYRCNETGRR